jgi:peptidoglycan/xylan/chitin deacetylase (PgdA/CDA1 family)
MFIDRKHIKKALAKIIHNFAREQIYPTAVITYHSVGSNCTGSQSINRFEEQIKLISTNKIVAPIDWSQPLFGDNRRYVIVTFDDGYLDNFDKALPILDNYNVKSIFFITTNFIENNSDITKTFKHYRGLKPMTWQNINDLVKHGHSIGLHGHTHSNMNSISYQQAVDEISHSLEILVKRIGIQPTSFAYPFGQYHHRRRDLAEVFKQSHIEHVFTTDHKCTTKSELFGSDTINFVPRLRIDPDDDIHFFEEKLLGKYDFIEKFQRVKSSIIMRNTDPVRAIKY